AAQPVETAFLLTPGRSRSEDGPARLELSSTADAIRFELALPPGAEAGDFAVTISAADGGQIWSRIAGTSERTIVATVPANLFVTGDYRLAIRRLTSGEQAPNLAVYSFHFTRK